MDLSKLTNGEKVVSGAAILFIITTFLPWFTLELDMFGVSQSESGNGWDVGFLWGRFPALIALVMLIAVLASRLGGMQLPQLPITWGQLHLALGALVALLVILKLIIGEDTGLSEAEQAFFDEAGLEIKRAWGLFVAVIAAIGLAVGGFLMMNEEKSGTTGGAATPPSAF